jgi:mannosyltransferase OCH1-like enzyme
MCHDFIKNHFRPEILKAYDSLKPYAFKSDLWRYCVLYIHGGIYMDMRYKCVDDFRLTELLEEEHYVRGAAPTNIYNGLIVCKPKNPFLLKIINILTYHTNQRIIESSVFFGPILVGKILRPYVKCSMIYGANKICKKDKTILSTYNGYGIERKEQPHWIHQLNNKNIFNSR